MPDLVLNDREQKALRRLYAAEPVPGEALPAGDVLDTIAELVPCDAMGAVVLANAGHLIAEVEAPAGYSERFGGPDEDAAHNGPLYVGLMHWSRSPLQAEACHALPPGIVDGIAVGYRYGPDAVAQIWLDRLKTPFSDRDLAVLELMWPVFQRHLRRQPTQHLPDSVTVQERRVLMEVAAGLSNAEIAATLTVAPSTVRKHLENAYRKLGVTNRMAAVVAMRGAPLHAGLTGVAAQIDAAG